MQVKALPYDLQNKVLSELIGGVWHTTHPDRLQPILECGAILPEPDLSEKERWGTAIGPAGYHYVRSIGGVSLFDFRNFDPGKYSEAYPSSSWSYFVPCNLAWECAAWIEIDHEQLGSAFISGADLLARWKSEKSSRRIMPLIEAACVGALPARAFRRAFLVRDRDAQITPVDVQG